MVGADAAGQHGGAVGLVLELLEHDVEVDVRELAFAELGGEGGLGLLLELLDVVGAGVLLVAEDGVGDALGGHDALDDGAGLGRGADEGEGGLRLAAGRDELLDGLDDRLDGLESPEEYSTQP